MTQTTYQDLIALAAYYRWQASHGTTAATGARSPLTGKQYATTSTEPIHHAAHLTAHKAMARTYILEAKKARLRMARASFSH